MRSFTRKLRRRVGGTWIVSTSPGVHARDPHLRAVLQPGEVRELRVRVERLVEEHAAVADQEQPDGEQQQAADDERADERRDGFEPYQTLILRAAKS